MTAPVRPALARAVLLLVSLAFATPAFAQGRITVLNRERKPSVQSGVVILSETLSSVKIRRGESERSYDTVDVVEVTYGPGSAAYEAGLKALAANDLSNAESLFAQAAKDATPPWVAAQALLRQAEASSRRGTARLPQAREALDEFLRRFPEHRLLPRALLDKARCAQASGDAVAADGAASQVVQLAKDGKVTPDWTVRAHLALADLRLESGDAKAAGTAYAAAAQAADAAAAAFAQRPDLQPVVAELALAARTGTASCMLAAGDVGGARSYYTQLASEGRGNAALEAAAANGLAECDFGDKARLKDAQLGFAKVAVTAFAVPGERARALYFLGRCAEELGRQDAEPNGRQKATSYYQEVIDRYPGSRWARLAQEAKP